MTAEWLAGFFDGEGNLTPDRGAPRIQITQKERAVLDEIVLFLGFGKIYPNRTWHLLQIRRRSEILTFAEIVGPHLLLKGDALAATVAAVTALLAPA